MKKKPKKRPHTIKNEFKKFKLSNNDKIALPAYLDYLNEKFTWSNIYNKLDSGLSRSNREKIVDRSTDRFTKYGLIFKEGNQYYFNPNIIDKVKDFIKPYAQEADTFSKSYKRFIKDALVILIILGITFFLAIELSFVGLVHQTALRPNETSECRVVVEESFYIKDDSNCIMINWSEVNNQTLYTDPECDKNEVSFLEEIFPK